VEDALTRTQHRYEMRGELGAKSIYVLAAPENGSTVILSASSRLAPSLLHRFGKGWEDLTDMSSKTSCSIRLVIQV
jgi:hypothetical protein